MTDYKFTKYRLGKCIAMTREMAGLVIDGDEILAEQWDGTIIREIRAHLMAQNVGTFAYPADWWQAFKLRWFPKWARRRWPAKMSHIKVLALFPEYVPPPSGIVGAPLYVWEKDHGPFYRQV